MLKKILCIAIILASSSAFAEVVITPNGDALRAQVTGDDLESLKKIVPNFTGNTNTVVDGKDFLFGAHLDSSRPDYGTFEFGSVKSPMLADPRSPYRRSITPEGESVLTFSLTNREIDWVIPLYKACQGDQAKEPKGDGYIYTAPWASADRKLQFSCSYAISSWMELWRCTFVLKEPK